MAKKSSAERELEALLKRVQKAARKNQKNPQKKAWKEVDGKPVEGVEESTETFKEMKKREF